MATRGVYSGGVSIDATVSGTGGAFGFDASQTLWGGTASNTIVGSGGVLDIEFGGTAVGESILSGGSRSHRQRRRVQRFGG